MAHELHLVNLEKCTGDGICVEVCPENILDLFNEKARTVEDRASECIRCGQCVAVCPAEAMRMPELPDEDFAKLTKSQLEYDDFHNFLLGRRSVRKFKDKPVDRSLIEKIVEAASTAPMGLPPHTTEILVIDSPDELAYLLEQQVKDYRFAVKGMANPLVRPIIRLSAGAEDYRTLKEFILPLVKNNNAIFEKDGADGYNYHTPALMVFHADRRSVSYLENAYLTCSYAMLAAQALGLGTTIIGLTPPIIDRSKELRERYGIPRRNKVVTSLIVGHPKYKYRKSIRRKFPDVRYI